MWCGLSFLSPSFLHHIFLTCQQKRKSLRLGWVCSCFPVVARRHQDCLGTSSPVQACATERLSLCCLFQAGAQHRPEFLSSLQQAHEFLRISQVRQHLPVPGLLGLPTGRGAASSPPPWHPCPPSPPQGGAWARFCSSGCGCGPRATGVLP